METKKINYDVYFFANECQNYCAYRFAIFNQNDECITNIHGYKAGKYELETVKLNGLLRALEYIQDKKNCIYYINFLKKDEFLIKKIFNANDKLSNSIRKILESNNNIIISYPETDDDRAQQVETLVNIQLQKLWRAEKCKR